MTEHEPHYREPADPVDKSTFIQQAQVQWLTTFLTPVTELINDWQEIRLFLKKDLIAWNTQPIDYAAFATAVSQMRADADELTGGTEGAISNQVRARLGLPRFDSDILHALIRKLEAILDTEPDYDLFYDVRERLSLAPTPDGFVTILNELEGSRVDSEAEKLIAREHMFKNKQIIRLVELRGMLHKYHTYNVLHSGSSEPYFLVPLRDGTAPSADYLGTSCIIVSILALAEQESKQLHLGNYHIYVDFSHHSHTFEIFARPLNTTHFTDQELELWNEVTRAIKIYWSTTARES